MRNKGVRIVAAALAAALSLFPMSFGQDKPKPERYSAVWRVVGGAAGGATVSIDILINKYNSDEEVKRYADILVEGGADKLRRTLEKEDVGQLSPVARVGTRIAIARKFVNGNKTIIRVVTARPLSFVELNYSGRSVDYPYTILQLELDEKGTGAGTAIGAAKIRFNKTKNTYEIESLQQGTAVNQLVNVRRMK
jgi:hypothetical protein